MILQRLVEYYDRIASDPETVNTLAKPGYSLQKVSFCVVLGADKSAQFQSMLSEGQARPIPRQLLVPGQSKPTGAGFNPCFLWDNAAYMLGYKAEDPKPERTRESFDAFRDRHLQLEKEINSPAFSAVCAFLKTWTPDQAAARISELKDITGSFGVFRLAGEQSYVHDDPKVVAYWARESTGAENISSGFCLVTGERSLVARLHEPKIKGVRDTQSAGALLVSFNDSAYESLGKEQGENAPVGVAAAFKYTNALNYLLSRSDRRAFIGDATVVMWAERPTVFEDVLSDLFAEAPLPAEDAPQEDKDRVGQARLFLSQLREGTMAGDAVRESEDATKFYILGLSPNASRVSIRYWLQSTVGELKRHLMQHVQDFELVGAREGEPPLVIRRIVQATGRAETDNKGRVKGYDTSAVSPLLAGAISRAVLAGTRYPDILLTTMLNRIKADGAVSHARVASIKGCLVRNTRLNGEADFNGQSKEVLVALDVSRKDEAYVTGRLFALLEKIQMDSADGSLNSTIKDRYFSSASATPGVVFPRLIRLSQHHMAKFSTGQKVYYERQLGEVMNKLTGFAPHLSIEDQGLFAVGYFHQRQDLYTSKKEKEGATE